jgi:peroxiredoxin
VAEPAAKAPPALEQGPDFELRSSAGGKQTLAALKGQVVVIEFGGSWCLSCRESRVELDQYVQQLSGKPVKVLGLSVRDKAPEAALERFKDQNHQFPLLIEADAVASAYHVRAYPTYYVLGFNHEVVKVEQGYTKTQTLANLSAAIEQYLASHPVPTAGSN